MAEKAKRKKEEFKHGREGERERHLARLKRLKELFAKNKTKENLQRIGDERNRRNYLRDDQKSAMSFAKDRSDSLFVRDSRDSGRGEPGIAKDLQSRQEINKTLRERAKKKLKPAKPQQKSKKITA